MWIQYPFKPSQLHLLIKLKSTVQKEYRVKAKIRHTIQNNLHHSTKILDNAFAKENAGSCEDNPSTNSREVNLKVKNLVTLSNNVLKHFNVCEM